MSKRTTAVVLNWNAYEETSRCVRSLVSLDADSVEIVVVDNGSTDGSGSRIDEEFDEVEVLYNDTNRGFGGGMNEGIERSLEFGAEYIWLLNNDVVVRDDDVLNELISTVETEDDVGVVSPLVSQPDGNPWFVRGYVDERSRDCGHCDIDDPADVPILENDYIPTCCVLFSASVFESVGKFDEQFFIYYDDVELCIRMRSSGYRLLTDTTCRVVHEGSATTQRGGNTVFPYYMSRNWWQLTRKHSSNRVGFLFAYFSWFVEYLMYLVYQGEFGSVRALSTGLVDGVLDRRGKGRYP